MGAKCFRQGTDVQGVASHQDCQRRKGKLFRTQIRQDARKDQVANARGYRRQSTKPRRDWTNTQAL